ncbi:hypothetical protein B0H34DRAFT_664731, partial [Crassisporium funariophilum]
VIYGIGPYIADYPEQALLACIVSGWCPRFFAHQNTPPFTMHFPRANIHELLSPNLLHQIIKGTFKGHIVSWVGEYFKTQPNRTRLIAEMDRR